MTTHLLERYPCLATCESQIEQAKEQLIACYEQEGKVLTCGNGGSCADADHIVGELMKGFLKKRPLSLEQKAQLKENCSALNDEILTQLQGGLPAISLCSQTALNTAFCNDVDSDLIYAQNVLGLGKAGDVFIGISTSGNAKNVVAAAKTAKGMGLTVIGLTGEAGGALKEIAHTCICVPQTETYRVQELHLPIYHELCAAVEAYFFEE